MSQRDPEPPLFDIKPLLRKLPRPSYRLGWRLLGAAAVLAVIGGAALAIIHWTKSDPKPVGPAYGYTLTPPSGWKQVEVSGSSSPHFKAPTEDHDSSGYLAPFISIETAPLAPAAQRLTFDKLAQSYASQLPQSYPDYQQISMESKSLGGTPAMLVVFSYTQGHTALTVASLFTAKHGVSYAINGESLTAFWTQNQPTIEESLLTFRP